MTHALACGNKMEGPGMKKWRCVAQAVFNGQTRILRTSSSMDILNMEQSEKVAKVLVLYTGGTIGMTLSDIGVLAPAPNALEECLKKFPHLHDLAYSAHHFPNNGPLVLPEIRDSRRVIYTICEYDPLLDSCDITMDDWVHIATDIKSFYRKFDGFVVLHGTDTMSYTASALSFMLEHLGKSVVITGSQIPLFEARSDGRDNFLGALVLAGNYCIPEVSLFFDNKLYRGNRSTKVDVSSLQAFNSPNLSPLASIGINVSVDWKSIYRSNAIAKFQVHTKLDRNVGLLRLFPGITVQTVEAFLRPPMRGVVLQTYGAGNAPSQRTDLLSALKDASDRGVIVINITQCATGSVVTSYETGQVLIDAGVIPGSDMTPEAALTKLSYVLGKDEWCIDTKRKMMQSNLRGELTVIQGDSHEMNLVLDLARAMQLTSSEEISTLRDILFPSLMCAVALSGDLHKLDLLEQHGGDPSIPDYSGRTPLHIASSQGHKHVVEHLLRNGATLHTRDHEGRTPLQMALDKNRHDVIELLRQAGAHFTLAPTAIGDMLTSAAATNDVVKLTSCKLAGLNLSHPDSTGRTALQVAVQCGRAEAAEFLVESGFYESLQKVCDNIPDVIM